MDTQNVSAQVYFKQLPPDPGAGQFGCNETGDVLSTCVNDVQTDSQIETAFQSQLDLSEYYKSPYVFDTMKRDYMDKTMEGSNTPVAQEVDNVPPPPPIPTPMMIPSGPTDFLKKKTKGKSFFGEESKNLSLLFVLFLIISLILLFVFVLKPNNTTPVSMLFGKR
jgi:hypothetical protein